MKASPWHSMERNPEITVDVVYHNNTECKQGKLMDKNHRRYGTDNRPLCKECGALNDSGK